MLMCLGLLCVHFCEREGSCDAVAGLGPLPICFLPLQLLFSTRPRITDRLLPSIACLVGKTHTDPGQVACPGDPDGAVPVLCVGPAFLLPQLGAGGQRHPQQWPRRRPTAAAARPPHRRVLRRAACAARGRSVPGELLLARNTRLRCVCRKLARRLIRVAAPGSRHQPAFLNPPTHQMRKHCQHAVRVLWTVFHLMDSGFEDEMRKVGATCLRCPS